MLWRKITAAQDGVYSGAFASVAAAQAFAVANGYSKVIVNSPWVLTANFTATLPIEFAAGYTVSCGAFTLNLTKGFIADDFQQVFLAANQPNITLPKWQRRTDRKSVV